MILIENQPVIDIKTIANCINVTDYPLSVYPSSISFMHTILLYTYYQCTFDFGLFFNLCLIGTWTISCFVYHYYSLQSLVFIDFIVRALNKRTASAIYMRMICMFGIDHMLEWNIFILGHSYEMNNILPMIKSTKFSYNMYTYVYNQIRTYYRILISYFISGC